MIFAVIGGSGLYDLGDGGATESLAVDTPFGKPSGLIVRRRVGENVLLFLPRHGKGHSILPSEINYRANIWALKKLGASAVLSISAVGSLQEEIQPGEFVLPGQYIDWTRGRRVNTFYGDGVVGHAHFADPVCHDLQASLAALCRELHVKCHVGGTYVCIEGPQFSTRAESELYRSWSSPKHPVSVIGMTAMPEARLAREAGLCYQTVAMATDYDCWNEAKGDVQVSEILRVLGNNVETSRRLVASFANKSFSCNRGCRESARSAVITSEAAWPPDRKETLSVLFS